MYIISLNKVHVHLYVPSWLNKQQKFNSQIARTMINNDKQMAVSLQALFWALTFAIITAVLNHQNNYNCIPHDRALPTDQPGYFNHGFATGKSEILSDFHLDLLHLQPVFQANCIIHFTPDQLHCDSSASHCSHQASWCYTKLPVVVHPIWLNIKLKLRSRTHSKFGKAPAAYYSNSTAIFNIPLTVSGDIEVVQLIDACYCTTQSSPCSDQTSFCGFFNSSWLTIYKYKPRPPRNCKFEHAPITYYSNCVASFNIVLYVCGDIESNPGPSTKLLVLPSLSSSQPISQPSPLSQTALGLSSKSTITSISAVLFNARSIVNKLLLFQTELDVYKLDIAFITESWLDNSIHDGELTS